MYLIFGQTVGMAWHHFTFFSTETDTHTSVDATADVAKMQRARDENNLTESAPYLAV